LPVLVQVALSMSSVISDTRIPKVFSSNVPGRFPPAPPVVICVPVITLRQLYGKLRVVSQELRIESGCLILLISIADLPVSLGWVIGLCSFISVPVPVVSEETLCVSFIFFIGYSDPWPACLASY